jgi:hypothetical protein
MKPEEALKLVEYLGLNDLESHEQAKEKFEAEYLPKKEHTAQIGKITSVIAEKTQKVFEKFGVEVKVDDLKNGKLEDQISKFGTLAFENHSAKVAELQKLAEASGSGEVIKEWEDKFSKAEKKIQTFEKQLKEKDEALNKTIEQFTLKEKQRKQDDFFFGQLGSIDLDPEVAGKATPKAKLLYDGFITTVKSKVKLEEDEKGEFYITDLSGERIKNPAKAGEFLTLTDFLQKEANEYGISKKNPKAGSPAGGQFGGRQFTPEPPERPKNISPRALGMAAQ